MNSHMKNAANKFNFSLISFFFALSAFILTTIGFEAYKNSDHVNGVFWPYLFKFYSLFKNNDNTLSSMNNTSLITLNDENIIKILIFTSILLSIVALATGYTAKAKIENSLYYATSIIAGLISFIYSMKILYIVF